MPIGHAADAHLVLAGHAVSRMRQARGQFTVARQQEQPFRIVVEAANGIDVAVHAPLGEQVDYRWTVFGIRAAGDVAARLVQEDVLVGFGARKPVRLSRWPGP